MSAAEGYEEFVSIVECGSITSAAQSLSLPRPTVSRRLARLEERLNVRLLHRTTRRLQMTPQGEALYATARRVVRAAREVEAEVRRLDGVPRGLLRVSIPTRVPADLFAGWFAEFLSVYPEVSLEAVASAAHVDLVGEGFDVALRAGPIEDASLIARVVATNVLMAVASPQYLTEHGTPHDAESLADHNCIVGYRAGSAPELRWPLLDGGSAPVSGTLATNQMELRREAARRHLGIALLVDYIAAGDIASGDLVPVLPDLIGRHDRVSLVYADRAFVDPKVRAFVDFFASRMDAVRARHTTDH